MGDRKLVTLQEYDKLAKEAGIELRIDVVDGNYSQLTVTEDWSGGGGYVKHYKFLSRADVAGKMLAFLYEQKLAEQEVKDI